MEHIAQMKMLSYDAFFSRMRKRINLACQKSNESIQSIPSDGEGRWTKERLLQQAELKRRDHLNAKDCKFSDS
jgi:hypothetical protein